jgi:DHA1 family bicyclomycin/chloramphenicol resistance-like MFS transporter
LLCAFAPTAWILVVLRLIQGLAGAAGIVVARAIVRDMYSGVPAARYFSRLILVMGLAPILAPVLGGQVLRFSSWHGIFVLLAIVTGLLFISALVWLPETLPAHLRRDGSLRDTSRTFRKLAADIRFIGFALSAGLAFGAMFAYIAGSPFVLQDIYGLSVQEYAVVFAVNALGLVAAAQVSGRIVHRIGARPLLGAGVLGSAGGGVGLLVAIEADAGVAAVLVAFFVVVASVGLVMPNAAALALEDHGANAGSASALLGFSQFFLGGVVAPIVGLAGGGSAVPTAAVIAILGLAALAAFALLTGTARQAVPVTD